MFSLYPLINKRIIASIRDFAKKFLHIYKTGGMDEEQSISLFYKQTLVNGSEYDTVVIKRMLGASGRAIANSRTERILRLEKQQVGYDGLKSYISCFAHKRYVHEGKESEGFAWAGQVMGMIYDVPYVDELIKRMVKEAETIRRRWQV